MSKRGLLALAALLLFAAAGAGMRWWSGDDGRNRAPAGERAFEGLDALAGSFPAPGDAALSWPRDHGAKPDQFAESWLFAGVVRDAEGQRHGFQLVFQRVALPAEPAARSSAWATRNVYRARLSIEPAVGPVTSAERLSRDALGLAGAGSAPARAWVEDWSLALSDTNRHFELRATAAEGALELRIELPDSAPMPVDGSVYRGYWWPGLGVDGHMVIDGRSTPVTGRAMLDRLWGRGLPAGRGQLSLARLWLEQGDGQAMRCEHLQRRGGGGTPLVECLTWPGATPAPVVTPEPEGWRSISGQRFPLGWTVATSAGQPALRLTPLSTRHGLALDGSWAGVMRVGGDDDAWGLLALSNFTAP